MKNFLFLFLMFCSSVFSQSLDSGLVAYFPFLYNAMDYSDNNHKSTVTGATLTTDRFGAPYSAYLFDGIDDNIIVYPNPIFELAGNRTLSVWVQSNDTGHQGIVGYLESSDGHMGYMIGICADKSFTSFEDNYNGTDGTWLHTKSDDYTYAGDRIWHHIVGLRRNDTTHLYVDNVRQSATTILKPLFSENSNILIGTAKASYPFQNFSGKIDEIRLYNRPLTEVEISMLYGIISIKDKVIPKPVTKMNISNDYIRISEDSHIKCFDMLGRTIYQQFKLAGNHKIDLPNGIYVLELLTKNSSSRKRFQIIK